MRFSGAAQLSRGAGRGKRSGAATVELAMILPVMLMLLFGTLEIGLMVRTSGSIGHVARETARTASMGATPSQIASHVRDVSVGLNDDRLSTSLHYRHWNQEAGTWGNWTILTGDGVSNIAQSDDQIRVVLTYKHLLATGGLLADVFGASDENTVTVDATVVSVRE